MVVRQRPGEVRDAIIGYFKELGPGEATISDVCAAVSARLGRDVPPSSVRSYLRLNTPGTFERTARGRYTLTGRRR